MTATWTPASDRRARAGSSLESPAGLVGGHEGARGDRPLGTGLVVGGAVGLGAAFALAVEGHRLLTDPEYVPTCSINPVLSCQSVMQSPQAELFGFPNPFLGLVGFTVVLVTGVLLATGPDGLPLRRVSEYVVCTPGTRVETFGPLPALEGQWIDLTLFIRTGREGRIELHADGRPVAAVSRQPSR